MDPVSPTPFTPHPAAGGGVPPADARGAPRPDQPPGPVDRADAASSDRSDRSGGPPAPVVIGRAAAAFTARIRAAGAPGALAAAGGLRAALRPFSAAARQRYPQLLASNAFHFAVLGEDGMVRRFPVDHGMTFMFFEHDADGRPNGVRTVGRTLAKQVARYYDAHWHAVMRPHAGYVFDPGTHLLVYFAAGRPTASLPTAREAYLIAPGKWMIPQTDVRECTHACEEMLLAEGQPAEAVIAQLHAPLSEASQEARRRNLSEIADSLRQRSGHEPTVIDAQGWDTEHSVKTLRDMLGRHGPCIFSTPGHSRMLDAINRQGESWLFDFRDPFTGTVGTIRHHEGIWETCSGAEMTALDPAKLRTWDAIFLPRMR